MLKPYSPSDDRYSARRSRSIINDNLFVIFNRLARYGGAFLKNEPCVLFGETVSLQGSGVVRPQNSQVRQHFLLLRIGKAHAVEKAHVTLRKR